jgi:hypothetical protein
MESSGGGDDKPREGFSKSTGRRRCPARISPRLRVGAVAVGPPLTCNDVAPGAAVASKRRSTFHPHLAMVILSGLGVEPSKSLDFPRFLLEL